MGNYAGALCDLAKYAESEELQRDCLARSVELRGELHPSPLNDRLRLSTILRDRWVDTLAELGCFLLACGMAVERR